MNRWRVVFKHFGHSRDSSTSILPEKRAGHGKRVALYEGAHRGRKGRSLLGRELLQLVFFLTHRPLMITRTVPNWYTTLDHPEHSDTSTLRTCRDYYRNSSDAHCEVPESLGDEFHEAGHVEAARRKPRPTVGKVSRQGFVGGCDQWRKPPVSSY